MTSEVLFLLLLALSSSHGYDEETVSHLILLDDIPPTFSKNATPEIVIRTNFSGQVEFQEADEFKVLLNITAPSILEAYSVDAELLDDRGKLLLQVFQKPNSGTGISLKWVFIIIGCAGGLMLLLTTAYVVWWYTQKKYLDIYNTRGYLAKYRSRNSIQLGAAAELLGDVDKRDEEDMEDEKEGERRKLVQEKLKVSLKPETIIEESEDSADDDRTNPKARFQLSGRQHPRDLSFRQRDRQRAAQESMHGSGILDYQDQSGDELNNVNDLSPDQIIAGADGSYTPLDELDYLHGDPESQMQSAQSTAKLPDPRGNLDYNIQTSKSDGDLLCDQKKMSEKEKVIIPQLNMKYSPSKKTPSRDIPKRAEPNIYHRGLNLPQLQENDLSISPGRSDRVRAQVHTPENPYVNSAQSHYIALKTPDQMSKSRTSRESNDAYELYTYPADIPMSTFKTANTVQRSPIKESPARSVPKVKPKPMFHSGSPNAFDFNKLYPDVQIEGHSKEPCSPGSPGNFSMLSEGSESDSNSNGGNDSDFMHLDDSDLDMPPPDTDAEVLSNASLPLPSPPPMSNQFMPFDTHGQISQLSPRQSLVTPLHDNEYGTVIALTGSPSPGGPYSKHSVRPGESMFQFPPPPVMFNPPQPGAWGRRDLNSDGPEGGEYVGLPVDTQRSQAHPEAPGRKVERKLSFGKRERKSNEPPQAEDGRERQPSGDQRERRQSGGRKGGRAPKHLQMMFLSTMCVLSVISGVYCATASRDTSINIIVFVPPSFPYKNATIVSAIDKTVEVKTPEGKNWFVSSNPILYMFGSRLCDNHRCIHGCDDNNGQCICHHGYMRTNDVCRDINECQTGNYRCSHPQASCANTPGSYDCLCNEIYHLFKYKDLCLDCAAPCQKGTYEVQPCLGDKQKKICKECTKSCGDDYYMKETCTEKRDAICLMCQPLCNGTQEYEFTQCSAQQNRDCRDKMTLPTPTMSNNVILDDLTVVRDETVEIPYLPVDFEGVRRFNFERGLSGSGSEFWIEVEIKHFKPIPMFRSVDHSDKMKQSEFQGRSDILDRYCPFPVPSYYELSFIKHNDLSYKGNTSRGMDTIEPCETDPDRFPNLGSEEDESILCAEPGPLSDVFHSILPEDYRMTKTVWEEKNERCRRRHEGCENCTRNCVQGMPLTKDECSVSADDTSGRSPRLPYCLTCCAADQCRDECKNYHDYRCNMVRCQKGNLVQFRLRPVYPKSDMFFCNVEQVLSQHLIRVEYRVKYMQWTSRPYLLDRELSVYSDEHWQKTGKIQRRDEIIHIEIDSRLTKIPDFIQWTPGSRPSNIKVGAYDARGTALQDTVVSSSSVLVRPKSPFGINSRNFSKHRCEDSELHNVVIATDQDGPYTLMPDLLSISFDNASYIITNKSMAPTVKIGLNRNTSVLKAVFKPALIKFGSFVGNMTYNATHWIVSVSGEMQDCPGFFNLNITDPLYPKTPLYHFDVGVECPVNFQMAFTIPTGDSPLLSKDILVHVRDVTRTYLLRVHTPAQITQAIIDRETAERDVVHEIKQTVAPTPKEPPHFSVVFITVIIAITLILLGLLLFGVAWKQGIPEGELLRFRLRHLVLLVVYITFQFVYAIFVSMTVFVLIVIAVNGETTAFLKQYNNQRSVTSALSQLELDAMGHHMRVEFLRQNEESKSRKNKCYQSIHSILADVEKMRQAIETEAMNSVQKQNLTDLITRNIKATLDEFSNNLLNFRNKYHKYEQYVLQKLTEQVETTYDSIQTSKWLQGAEYLYRFVEIHRKLMNKDFQMVPFMTWVDMETDMMNLAKGLTLPLPDLPNLSPDFTTSKDDKTSRSRKPNVTPMSVQTINKWFVQPDLVSNNRNNTDDSTTGPEKTARVTSFKTGNYSMFVIGMVIIDILWLLHRMFKAAGIGKLLLYGYPIYVDVREQKEGPNNEEKKKLNKKSKMKAVRTIFVKGLSTFFIPKLIGTIFVGLMVYFVSLTAYKFINRETFNYLGYYNDMEDVLSINEAVVNTRIHYHAERINNLEYPMYEEAMNVNLQTHQRVLNLVEKHWRAIKESHSMTYCAYLRQLNVSSSCEDSQGDGTLAQIRLDGCSFPPVIPGLYERNATSSTHIAGAQMDGFLLNIRRLVSDTSFVIIIYMAAIVIKELLGTVLWIYTKRSGFVSLRIIYETDEAPGSTDTSTTNK